MRGQHCHDFQEKRKEEEKPCLGRLEADCLDCTVVLLLAGDLGKDA